MSTDPVLTPHEVAAELGKNVKTIRLWLQSGELRGSKHGRDWYIRRSWFDEFLSPTNQTDVA